MLAPSDDVAHKVALERDLAEEQRIRAAAARRRAAATGEHFDVDTLPRGTLAHRIWGCQVMSGHLQEWGGFRDRVRPFSVPVG